MKLKKSLIVILLLLLPIITAFPQDQISVCSLDQNCVLSDFVWNRTQNSLSPHTNPGCNITIYLPTGVVDIWADPMGDNDRGIYEYNYTPTTEGYHSVLMNCSFGNTVSLKNMQSLDFIALNKSITDILITNHSLMQQNITDTERGTDDALLDVDAQEVFVIFTNAFNSNYTALSGEIKSGYDNLSENHTDIIREIKVHIDNSTVFLLANISNVPGFVWSKTTRELTWYNGTAPADILAILNAIESNATNVTATVTFNITSTPVTVDFASLILILEGMNESIQRNISLHSDYVQAFIAATERGTDSAQLASVALTQFNNLDAELDQIRFGMWPNGSRIINNVTFNLSTEHELQLVNISNNDVTASTDLTPVLNAVASVNETVKSYGDANTSTLLDAINALNTSGSGNTTNVGNFTFTLGRGFTFINFLLLLAFLGLAFTAMGYFASTKTNNIGDPMVFIVAGAAIFLISGGLILTEGLQTETGRIQNVTIVDNQTTLTTEEIQFTNLPAFGVNGISLLLILMFMFLIVAGYTTFKNNRKNNEDDE